LMQIRRLNGGRLTGIKATLKATPERISYSDRDGTRHTSVAYILSVEIGAANLRALVANMTEPVRLLGEGRAALDLSRGVQYVVRETDAERAEEIAGEFYPNGKAAAEEPVEPAIGQSERDEQLARICELARRLRFNDAKTKMLIGQSAGDLAGLERKLVNELDDQPGRKSAGNGDNGHRGQPKNETSQTSRTATSKAADRVPPDGSAPPDGGFLF
jgi:hypothetical protein